MSSNVRDDESKSIYPVLPDEIGAGKAVRNRDYWQRRKAINYQQRRRGHLSSAAKQGLPLLNSES